MLVSHAGLIVELYNICYKVCFNCLKSEDDFLIVQTNIVFHGFEGMRNKSKAILFESSKAFIRVFRIRIIHITENSKHQTVNMEYSPWIGAGGWIGAAMTGTVERCS